MAWFCGCFKYRKRNKTNRIADQKQDVVASSPSRDSSLLLCGARWEDLYKVRQSPPSLSLSSRDGLSLPSLRSQAQSKSPVKDADGSIIWAGKAYQKVNHAEGTKAYKTLVSLGKQSSNARMQVNELEEDLENLRRKLIEEADAARKLSEEVKYLRACHERLESPDAYEITVEKVDKGSADDPWHVSSVLAKFQSTHVCAESYMSLPGNQIECPPSGCLKPSSEKRGLHDFQGADSVEENKHSMPSKEPLVLQNSEASLSAKLMDEGSINTSTEPQVPSSPWFIIESRSDQLFENSEDLLLEHIDLSSLITDSELITNWENSYGRVDLEGGNARELSMEVTAQSWVVEGDKRGKTDIMVESMPCNRTWKRQKTSRKRNMKVSSHSTSSSLDSTTEKESAKDFKITFKGIPVSQESDCHNGNSDEASTSRFTSTTETSSSRSFGSLSDGHKDYSVEGRFFDPDSEMESQFDKASSEGSCTGIDEGSHGTAYQSCSSLHSASNSTRDTSGAKDIQDVSIVPEMPRAQASSNVCGVQMDLWEKDDHQFSDAWSHVPSKSSDRYRNSKVDSLCTNTAECNCRVCSSHICTYSSKLSGIPQSFTAASTENKTGTRGTHTMPKFALHDLEGVTVTQSAPDTDCSIEEHQRQAVTPELVEEVSDVSIANIIFEDSTSASGVEDKKPSCSTLSLSSTISAPSPKGHSATRWVANHHAPARYTDDRPILGTVAAHWSPIATRKWWDGKGIPNSTTKYKEDQKVNWHATPFEVRLEQALAKQR